MVSPGRPAAFPSRGATQVRTTFSGPESENTMSGTLLDVAVLLGRLVYPDLGMVLCQDGARTYERAAYITSMSVLALPWVCRRRARKTDGSVNSSTHATRLEALHTLVAEGYQTLVGITE